MVRTDGLRARADGLFILSQTQSQVEDSPMARIWFPWLRAGSTPKRATKNRPISRRRPSSVPQLDLLEDRTVLSVLTVLNTADSGAGSLRDTLAAAQSGDTIVFDPSLAHETITLSSGPLALTSNLTIDGLGADLLAISGNNASQLFTLNGSAQVTLDNLTLTGGMSSQGGAIFIGGTAALTLDSDILSGNQAVGDSNGNALGGAVYNNAGASLTIDNTAFVNDQTNGTNVSFGGAIANAGSLTIDRATFTGNVALGSTTNTFGSLPGGSLGGAIGNLDGAAATITLSTFTGNQALGTGTGQGDGGAVCNESGPAPVTGVNCTLSQCTFANNTSMGGVMNPSGFNDLYGGGAIEAGPGTNLTIISCSFTGNQANNSGSAAAAGGAIDTSAATTTTISDSQFISNSAIGSGAGTFAAGGALSNFGTVTIANSLFTGNRALGGPMADGNTSAGTIGQGQGGAILMQGSGAILTLSNSIIAGNEAIGGSGASTLAFPQTGAAFGGGIRNNLQGTLNVTGCTITGNRAIGGASAEGNGSPAFGGGIRNSNGGTLNLTNSTVSNNLCQGGAGASGAKGGIASGGGIDTDLNYHAVLTKAILTDSTISFNECIGGAGGAGAKGGAALGGGITNADETFAFGLADASVLVVSNCQVIGNAAQGGTAGPSARGGDGLGGGLFAGGGTVELQAVLVNGNQAQGGVDSQGSTTGNGLGGGVYVDPSASATMDMETYIAGNQASKSDNDVWGTITIVP
jgi:hypothetical protein